MDIQKTLKAIKLATKHGLVPNLIGKHGLGKSSVVKQLADSLGMGFYPLFLGQYSDSGDIQGLPEFVRDEKGNAIAIDFIKTKLLPVTPNSIIFLDELSHCPKEIRGILFQLILEKRFGSYELPANSFIVTAMNPDTADYPALIDINANKALGDRFLHIKFEPSKQEFFSYMEEKYGKNNIITSFLRSDSTLVDDNSLEEFSLDFVSHSRRSWESAQKLMSDKDLTEDIKTEVLMGLVGTSAAIALTSFEKSMEKDLTGEEVLTKFEESVPRIKKLFVNEDGIIRSDVVSKINEEIVDVMMKSFEEKKDVDSKTMESFLNFLKILPVEMALLCLKTHQQKPRLISMPEYMKMLDNNEKFFLDLVDYDRSVK